MANSIEIMEYKQTIMSLLVKNKDIVDLIEADPNEVEYDDDLINKYIFSYYKNPDTEDEQQTYIFVFIDAVSTLGANDLMKNLTITFVVSTHKRLMRVNGKVGNRIDSLSALIDKQFNNSNVLGVGYLKLISNVEGNIDNTHPCRTLKFRIEDFDDVRREQMLVDRELGNT